MKNAIVRFATLYVYTVAVLLLIGLFSSRISVGVHAFWAAVILTLGALFLKPLLGAVLRRSVAKSTADRSKTAERVVQYALVYVVELILWIATVVLSGVRASGFWAYAIPPLVLLIGWVVYDLVDDAMQRKASELYDSVQARVSGGAPSAAPSSPPSATADARAELNDGLTPEQRRMLDELG